MSTSSLSALGQPLRSVEWLISPDALLSSTALATGQLGSLGPLASLVEDAPALPATEGAAAGLAGSATDIADRAVLDLHAALENLGHEVAPLNGPIHALTHLGETVGLGHIGEPGHLVSDLVAIPQTVATGGGLAAAAPALSDLGGALGAADGLATSVVGSATSLDLLAPNGALGPVANLANATVLDLHATLEGIGHDVPILNGAIHGLTGLGETVGLGHLGQGGNLLTDVAGLPGALLEGQGLGALAPIVVDLGAVTGAATGLLDDIIQIPGSLLDGTGTPLDGVLVPVTSLLGGLTGGSVGGEGGLLAPVTGLLGGVTGGAGLAGDLLGPGALLQPVGDVANGVINGIHAGLETLGHDIPLLNAPLHELIGLGTAVGLGALGEGGNLLTDAVNLPGDVLSGNGAAGLDHVVSDLGHVAQAAGNLVGTVPGVVDGLLGGDGTGTPLDGVLGGLTGGSAGGGDGLLAPVTAAVEPVLGTVLGTVTEGGAGSPVEGVLSPVLSTVGGLTGGLMDGGSGSPVDGVLAPVLSTVGDLTGGLTGGTGPLGGPLGGLLGGLTGGDSAGGSADTHPLIDVAVGPVTPDPIANAGVLSPPADPAHAIEVGAIGVPASQPSLLDAGLLTGDSLPLPAGGGTDSLVGQVLDTVHTVTSGPAEAEASHGLSLDLGLATIDLGGHVDVQHTDPTPHTATGGLHLLGL